MKGLLGFTIILMALMGCGQSNVPANGQQKTSTAANAEVEKKPARIAPGDIFILADAEKIMGEAAHLQDSSNNIKGDTGMYQCSYIATAISPNGKTGVIYFMLEQYGQASTAHQVYAGIKKANEGHGITTLELGDEAYFHTDKENFYFIMARKGTRMIRMKVNKITATTSEDEFNRVAGNIITQL